MVRGARYGSQGFQYGNQGAQLAASEPQPPTPVRERGVGYGRPVGARYGTRAWGGSYGSGPASVDDILARTDGWALIAEREDGERYIASAAESPTHDIISLSLTYEVNNLSDWRVTVPPDPALYDFSFADVVIGFDGERLFHGQLLPVSGSSSGAIEIGGFGPLWYATHGNIEVTYAGMPVWQAVNDAWERIADLTDSRVRGYALRPPPGREVWLSEEGQDFSGTPLAVLKELHGIGGLAFTLDHTDPAAVGVSFAPGAERRTAEWRAADYTVELDPTGYHNRVTVIGAKASDAYQFDRWRGTARVTDAELTAVTNGEWIDYWAEKPELQSPAACEQRAESILNDLRSEFSITGDLTITPARATPGFVYRVEEFERAAPDPFVPVELPLQSVEHSFAQGDASTTLNFKTVEGVVGAIRDRIQPDAASTDISWQDLGFSNGGEIHVWGESVWGAGEWGGG